MSEADSSSNAEILTRNVFPKLTQQLDASDVLECYGLVRNAPLHQPQLNVTFTVQKMAVGLRYQPNANSFHKEPLELTLEYGPLRMDLVDEAMPTLQSNGDYLAWSNSARVYYTTQSIHSLSWKSAYYMASLTGAVLETVLEGAVAYTESRPRYQPFSVWQNDKQILRTSSSIDFVYGVWENMAKLGVEIRPILPPPTYLPRLFVQDLKKVSGLFDNSLVTKDAAVFYAKLQDCWTSIATADYTMYHPETPAPTPSPSLLPSVVPSDLFSTDDVGAGKNKDLVENNNTNAGSSSVDNEDKQVNTTEPIHNETDPGDRRRWLTDTLNDVETQSDDLLKDQLLDNDDDDYTDLDANATTFPTASPHEASELQKAADEAHEFAAEAKNASSHEAAEKAADAAEAAANAAQKAADAAQAQTAKENLLSGDGKLASSALQECFSNAQFGLHNESGTIAYLYLDGSFFYRLNMTSPYIDVVEFNRPLPSQRAASNNQGSDVVDVSLALVVIVFLVFGFFALLQQIGCRMAFYGVQKRFFSPGHHDDDDAIEEVSMHNPDDLFDDKIPFSMGGRGTPYKKRRILRMPNSRHLSEDERGRDVDNKRDKPHQSTSNGHVELVPVSSAKVPPRFARHPDLVDMPDLRSTSKVAMPVTPRSLSGDSDMKNPNRLIVV